MIPFKVNDIVWVSNTINIDSYFPHSSKQIKRWHKLQVVAIEGQKMVVEFVNQPYDKWDHPYQGFRIEVIYNPKIFFSEKEYEEKMKPA